MSKRYVLLAPLFALLLTTALSSCDDPETVAENVNLSFKATVGDDALVMNTLYTGPDGREFKMENLQFYASDISLIDADGGEHFVKDVLFADYTNGSTDFTLDVPAGEYTQIKFALGLSEELNGSDPSAFSNDHPLSYEPGMYWSWALKYIFVKFEGKVDTSLAGTGAFYQPFVYHLGFANQYRMITKDIEGGFVTDKGDLAGKTLSISVNVPEFFTAIHSVDYLTQTRTHEDNALAGQLMDNLSSAIRVY